MEMGEVICVKMKGKHSVAPFARTWYHGTQQFPRMSHDFIIKDVLLHPGKFPKSEEA